MGSNQKFSRLDTLELKSLMYSEIGQLRAESYFDQLGRFFTLRITKSEFDKFCIKTIGRENIPLHNRLIHSIIKNATVAKSPPLRYLKKDGNKKNNHIQPHKFRSRKFRDRPSPLGPLGKPQSLTTTNDESMSKAQSATELLSLGSRPPMEVASVEEGEEVEQIAGSPGVQSWSPVTAPFGVSMKHRNGARHKSISDPSICYTSITRESCQSSCELPDTRTLKSRLEKKLEMEGIKISMDSVTLLNTGLDAFITRLLEPCLSLANSRCGREMKQSKRVSCVSISDLRAAMELNPRILGEEWPILLEKICSRASEE